MRRRELVACCLLRNVRFMSRKSDRLSANDDIPEHLLPFASGRGRQERKDSLSLQILEERKKHAERLELVQVSSADVQALIDQGFGTKHRLGEVKTIIESGGSFCCFSVYLLFL